MRQTRFAGKYATPGFTPTDTPWQSPLPYRRDTPKPASLNAADTTFAAKPTANRYTGSSCIGIAAMHKSNLVPIFNSAAAVDAATMRRN
jgi:hypothetical protein